MFSEDTHRDEKWQEVYHRAVLEVDYQKMPERIVAARRAIGERLRGLVGDPNHHAERHQVEDALRALAILEAETKHW
jgi:hypothetical protein